MVVADPTLEETRLVSQAQGGDREAFCELVRRYRLQAVDVVYRMCGDSALAEDAAQMAFIRAWQHLASFQPRATFRSWLYRIAVNAALDAIRKEKPGDDIEEIELAAPGERMEARVEQRERAQIVRKAILALPEAARAVLVLREYRALSYHEIADALDIPLGTVMSRLNYARTRLEEILRPLLEEA